MFPIVIVYVLELLLSIGHVVVLVVVLVLREHYIVVFVGWHYLSNATRLIQAFLVLCAFLRVEDHHKLLQHSPILRKSCATHHSFIISCYTAMFLLRTPETEIESLEESS